MPLVWPLHDRQLAMALPAQNHGYDLDEQKLLWDLACLAIRLLKQDPAGLRGMLVAASHGPVHQAFQTLLSESFRLTRIPVTVSEERLTGGLDINETLAQGKRIHQPGLLDTSSGALLINGAERLETTVSAILASHLDTQHDNNTSPVPIVIFDESLPDETGLSESALGDRLGLMLPLPDLPWQALQLAMDTHHEAKQSRAVVPAVQPDATRTTHALSTHKAISSVSLPDGIMRELTQLANHLGISSMRPVVFACRVARGHAWLDGRTEVDMEDATVATRLVLAPRATQLPQPAPDKDDADPQQQKEESAEPPEDESPDLPDDDADELEQEAPPDSQDAPAPEAAAKEQPEEEQSSADMAEQLLDAASATLPQHLIADLVRGQKAGNTTGRDSKASSSGTQGRPAGVRRPRGRSSRERLNIVETLKSAAPRQRLRGRTIEPGAVPSRLQIRVEDFRITRFKQPTRTTTLFVVDASGSAALHRLAEAKGAVELLLAECYVRRDRVAMISFRGLGAVLELPPTRSLVRAKRQLSGLPGGGGTPLAAGLDLAADVVRQLKQAGETPVVVVMTDGKANINRRGEGSRTQALEDAESAARQLAQLEVRTLFIDTSPRPRPQAAQLAAKMRARYLPLPPGGASRLPGLLQP